MPASFTSWIVIWGAVLAYGALHSLLASLRAKTLAQQRLGDFASSLYRLVYNLIAIITLLPVLALPFLLPDHPLYTIPYPWTLLTALLQGIALLTLLAGLQQTGFGSFLGIWYYLMPRQDDSWYFSDLRPSPGLSNRQPPRLVISGLYRYVRHPLYSAGLVFLWLTPIMTTNALALILGLSLYTYFGAHFEERRLIHEFGQAYLDYQQCTPMFIPKLFNRSI